MGSVSFISSGSDLLVVPTRLGSLLGRRVKEQSEAAYQRGYSRLGAELPPEHDSTQKALYWRWPLVHSVDGVNSVKSKK